MAAVGADTLTDVALEEPWNVTRTSWGGVQFTGVNTGEVWVQWVSDDGKPFFHQDGVGSVWTVPEHLEGVWAEVKRRGLEAKPVEGGGVLEVDAGATEAKKESSVKPRKKRHSRCDSVLDHAQRVFYTLEYSELQRVDAGEKPAGPHKAPAEPVPRVEISTRDELLSELQCIIDVTSNINYRTVKRALIERCGEQTVQRYKSLIQNSLQRHLLEQESSL